MADCKCRTTKGRGTAFREVLFRPGSAAALCRREGHREKGYLAVADLRPGRISVLAASPDRATPVARTAHVKSDEVRAAAGALPGNRPVDLEVRGQQRQGIPDPPFVEAISMMTAKAVSRIWHLAASLGTCENGRGGCSPSLRQFPAEQGTNGNRSLE